MKKLTMLTVLLSSLTVTPALGADARATWLNAITRQIAKKQTYPRSAQIRGEEGTTRLRIVLNPDGTINQVELAASSGSAILDREAQSVMSAIGRFPAPPSGLRNVFVPIVWRLN